VFIKKLRLQNFRCFDNQNFDFSQKFIIVQGKNGSGKSSILEALHYACYLRSFRTHANRDLIKLGGNHFFIEIDVDHDIVSDQIQVGFGNQQGKVVKFNQKPILSYRDLILQYRTVTLCADDIVAVSGSPEFRRDYLNHSLLLIEPSRYGIFKRYKQILEQRNSLLLQIQRSGGLCDQLEIWSEKLWADTVEIKKLRIEYLEALERRVNVLLSEYFFITEPELQIKFSYISKNINLKDCEFQPFWNNFYKKFNQNEVIFGRSLFGAHLDDFGIEFYGKKAKLYASRGQQKLIIFLIKVAQLFFMSAAGKAGVLLLDDFLTDFDKQNLVFALKLLQKSDFQIFITNPDVSMKFALKKVDLVQI